MFSISLTAVVQGLRQTYPDALARPSTFNSTGANHLLIAACFDFKGTLFLSYTVTSKIDVVHKISVVVIFPIIYYSDLTKVAQTRRYTVEQ